MSDCSSAADKVIGYLILLALGGAIAAGVYTNARVSDFKTDINKIEARIVSEPHKHVIAPQAPVINITNNINSNNVAPPVVRNVVKPRYTKVIKKTIIVHRHKQHTNRNNYRSCDYGCRYYTP